MEERKLNRRDFLRLSAGATAGVILAGCGPGATPQPTATPQVVEKAVETPAAPARDPYELPNAATGVPYEIKASINDGKPIQLDYWEWALDRSEYEKEWAQEYMDVYPNVTIEVTNQSWDDYWAKLAVNVPAGQGPAVWHFHTDKLTEFCDGGLMEPMPDYVADQDFLDKHWFGFAEGAFNCPGSGSRHFIPMGAQLPVLFINTRLWEEAGLTDADVPKDWEALREVAKALTKYDDAGRIIQAGFQSNWNRFLKHGLYQQGRYMFTSDRKHAQLDNEEAYNAMKFIQDLHVVDKVVDPEFPPLIEAFSSEQTAMVVEESWLASVIRRNNPDLDWFAALMPTYSGSLEPAVGHMHFAVEAVVNAFAPPEVKKVAWDFWHFLYSNDERLVRTIALRNGMLPAYDKLADHPAVKADPFAAVLVPGMEYGVIVGETPDVWYTTTQNLLIDAVLVGGMSIREALKAAEEEVNAQLAQRESWNILERNYKHDDLMIPNQP